MSIEGLIGGIMVLIASASSGTVDTKTVYQGAVLVDKAIQKRDWSASAHEEGHSGLKSIILKLGHR